MLITKVLILIEKFNVLVLNSARNIFNMHLAQCNTKWYCITKNVMLGLG